MIMPPISEACGLLPINPAAPVTNEVMMTLAGGIHKRPYDIDGLIQLREGADRRAKRTAWPDLTDIPRDFSGGFEGTILICRKSTRFMIASVL
jgi:hypothetical protein